MEPPDWHPQWQALCDRLARRGYSSLSDNEKIWVNVRALIDSTNNGGFISYFYNSYADTLQDCLRALDALEAHEIRAQVERVCSLFGTRVPPDIDERNEIINSWPDEGTDAETRDTLLEEVDQALFKRFDALEDRLEAVVKEARIAP